MSRFAKRLSALERRHDASDYVAYTATQMPGEPEPETVYDLEGNPHRRADIPDDGKHLIVIRRIVEAPIIEEELRDFITQPKAPREPHRSVGKGGSRHRQSARVHDGSA